MKNVQRLYEHKAESEQKWATEIYDLALTEMEACTRHRDMFSLPANSQLFQIELSKYMAIVLMRRGDCSFIDYRQLLPN